MARMTETLLCHAMAVLGALFDEDQKSDGPQNAASPEKKKPSKTKESTLAVLSSLFTNPFRSECYRIARVHMRAENDVLGNELKEFEREFEYPLGEESKFRIIHGKCGETILGSIGRWESPLS